MRKKIIIVGAGLSGLTAAAYLSKKGHKVIILESTEKIGGRAQSFRYKGFRFDLGASMILMKDVFERVFEELGTKLEKELELVDCNPIYRLVYEDNKKIDIPQNPKKIAKMLDKYENGSGKKYLNFLERKSILYNLFVQKIMNNHYKNHFQLITSVLKEKYWFQFLKSISWSFDEVCRIIKNPRLRLALMFNDVLWYFTSSSTAMLGVLDYTEQKHGLQYSKGGIGAISKALWKIAKKNNAKLYFNKKVTKVLAADGLVKGVQLSNGQEIFANDVIFSAPLAKSVQKKIIPKKWISRNPLKMKMSCSSLNLYLGIKKRLPTIKPHTLFMFDNFYENFSDIFDNFKITKQFCFYIHSVSQVDSRALPWHKKNGQTIVILVPLHNLKANIRNEDLKTLEKIVYQRISNYIGENFEKLIVVKKRMTPRQWEEQLELYNGAILGATATTFQMLTF